MTARPSFAPRADLVVDGCGILGIMRVATSDETIVWRGDADMLVAALRETAMLRMDGRWQVPGFANTQDADLRAHCLIAYRAAVEAYLAGRAQVA